MTATVTDDIAQIEIDCRAIAERYRLAAILRYRLMAHAENNPQSLKVLDRKFDAGMAESEAFYDLKNATARLIRRGHAILAAEIRDRAIRRASEDGLAAMKDTLKSEAHRP